MQGRTRRSPRPVAQCRVFRREIPEIFFFVGSRLALWKRGRGSDARLVDIAARPVTRGLRKAETLDAEAQPRHIASAPDKDTA